MAEVSPWLFAAACALLTLIIGTFAVNNYQREKMLMTEALLQKGITIIRFVISNSRASLRGEAKDIHVAMWKWTDHVQQAIDHASGQPGVDFLCLLDSDGLILASTSREAIGSNVGKSTLSFIQSLEEGQKIDGKFRVSKDHSDGVMTFQVAAVFSPLGIRFYSPAPNSPKLDATWLERFIRHHPEYQQWQEQLDGLGNKKFTILVELDLTQFNTAVKRQLLQIAFLSFVLLLVGVGGWLSLLTLQGLRGSQSRLQRMRAFTDMLISSLPVGLIATDSQGNIQICNQSAEEIVGVSEGNTIGNSPEVALPAPLVGILQQSHADGNSLQQKEIFLTDGTNRKRSLLLAGLSVIDDENRFAGNMLLIQDLSQIKELEEELRRNEKLAALGKMAAGVAHELRNPLSSIKGLAVLLRSRFNENTSDQETADILVREVERLNRSIGELLDYARPHNLETMKISLIPVLQKAMSLIRMDAEAMGIEMKTDFTENLPMVEADQDKLNQVFLNLFLNSVQAMENGGILRIGTGVEGSQVICSIEDTGCGVDPQYTSRVFDPYFTTKNDGTGLGLAISAKIIEEHGGTIEFESVADKGTIVKIGLPFD
ncbi:MAG: ATP-binding protein [Desulfocapsaceae bacterium]|nr:ATP-binding protein [Desulfocapsaceae bacterium]